VSTRDISCGVNASIAKSLGFKFPDKTYISCLNFKIVYLTLKIWRKHRLVSNAKVNITTCCVCYFYKPTRLLEN
jgi:hypothetical protein